MHVFFTILLFLLSYSLPCVGGFGIVSTSGGVFYEDGHPTRYAGSNALSLAQFSDPFTQQDILTRMHRANMTLLRLWAFSDGGVCSPPPSQNYFQCWDASTSSVFQNETALALHLDTALAAAGRAGVHVILSLVNNWPAYGGFAAYGEWREAASKAGVAPSLPGPFHHDDFYADPIMKGWYRSWVSTVANRTNTVTGVAYKEDPTIFAYQLGNELACTNSSSWAPCVAPSGTSPLMRAWVHEMSSHLKSLDGSHMVSIGDEGFYGADDTGSAPCPTKAGPTGHQWWCNGSSGDWLGLLRLPTVDFATVHMYPDSFGMKLWGIGSEDEVAVGWVANHTREAHALGKPVLFEEVGNGAAGLDQHTKYDLYMQAVANAGGDGWGVWMLAALQDQYSHTPNWPTWWKGADASLQVYCLNPGGSDPPIPSDGGAHDPESCAVLTAAAAHIISTPIQR